MKYINVNDFIDELNKYLEDTPLDFNYSVDKGILEGVSIAFRVLDKMPVVDLVKQGNWEYVDKCHIQEWQAINKCSVCGRSVCDATYGDKVVHFKYCPHCGADMRGGISGE